VDSASHDDLCDLGLATMSTATSLFSQINTRWFQRSIGWTGIEIGCHEVKMAQVRKLDGRWILSSIWTIENPVAYTSIGNECIGHRSNRIQESFGWMPSTDLLEKGLAPLFTEAESLNGLFQGKRCAVTLNDGMIDYRELDLPFSNLEDAYPVVSSEVAFEAECEQNELITDCWQLPKSRSRHESSTYAAVSLKCAAAEQMSADLLRIGFDCQVIDAVPSAIARATQMMIQDNESITLAIDLGYGQSTVTMVQEDEPVLTRSLRSCSLLSLLEGIARVFEVSVSDAQTLLFQSSANDSFQNSGKEGFSNPLRQRTDVFLNALSFEINKTLEYYSRAFYSVPPQRILIMGAGVKIPGIASVLEQKTNLPTFVWSMESTFGPLESRPLGSFAIAAGLSCLAWDTP
jgi:Tfp pilus assembly PilM family ATPase